MTKRNHVLNGLASLERLLEVAIAILCGLLAIAACVGLGWQFALGFAILALTFGLPNAAWKTLSLGRPLRYLLMAVAAISLS